MCQPPDAQVVRCRQVRHPSHTPNRPRSNPLATLTLARNATTAAGHACRFTTESISLHPGEPTAAPLSVRATAYEAMDMLRKAKEDLVAAVRRRVTLLQHDGTRGCAHTFFLPPLLCCVHSQIKLAPKSKALRRRYRALVDRIQAERAEAAALKRHLAEWVSTAAATGARAVGGAGAGATMAQAGDSAKDGSGDDDDDDDDGASDAKHSH